MFKPETLAYFDTLYFEIIFEFNDLIIADNLAIIFKDKDVVF